REAALAACRSHLADTVARLARLDSDLDALAAQIREGEERLVGGRVALADLKGQQARLDAEHAGLVARRRQAQDAYAQAQTQLDAAGRLLAERSSRLATLTELQQSGEGFYQGVRAVLTAVRQGKLRGSYTPVVDLLTVPEPYRVAIEVALGASAQDI